MLDTTWLRLTSVQYTLAAAVLACGVMPLTAQSWPFPWPEDRIARYTARRAASPTVIDGRLDEAHWRAAERSPRFADLIGGRPGIHDTRAAVLWDDTYLYVGYWVEEPFVEATLTERDAPIYENNDVELFIAGRDAYYEFEMNAFGTIYEVFFIWEREFESSGYARRPEFDRSRPGVRPFNGVGFKQHPRGPRIGYWNWDMPGLETAVHVDGTINDNTDRDRGWTAELRIPWRSLEPLAMPDGRALPPRDGDEWRMDFSRFNQYKEAPPAKDPGGWAWSPHGVWDSHIPELFTRVHFSTEPAGQESLQALPRHRVIDDRSHFDRHPAVVTEEAGGNLDGLVEVARFDECVSAQLFAGFGKGPVGQQALALAHAHGGG